ncbi:hypothetical protein PVAND_013232 [Polypedilum vanderplanki]|uniref:Uncharacterized protein n=1 Tax=Polypedilum vanderplanki TaxID=319348 RepID=A0A9J6CP15_POLVA|nr:hypothetical protein PVAND_013232 [Polypedilum vanderplanki]
MKSCLLFIVLFALCCGSFARTIALLSKNDKPVAAFLPETKHTPVTRIKRQFGFGPFGQSSAQANANAFNNYFGPNGFGSSNALAGAQSFNSASPYGNFGAAASNSAGQNFNCAFTGCSGNANFAGSQSYNLPNGHKLSLAYGNGFNFAPGQAPKYSNSNSISYV